MTEFQFHQARTRDDFGPITQVVWDAMQEPFNPAFHWLHPVHGYTEGDRSTAMKEDADRIWKSHSGNPASNWFYVTDASGEVCGVVQWQVYTSSPFPNGPVKLQCTWFPEGETRDFVTEFINQIYYARMNWLNRPFVVLNGMCVKPNMRGRGIGSLMMDWGIQKADSLGLECWIEASDLGRDLYEKYGFQVLMSFAVNMHKKSPSQTWTRLQNQFATTIGTVMWRPSRKNLMDGSPASFWQIMVDHATSQASASESSRNVEGSS